MTQQRLANVERLGVIHVRRVIYCDDGLGYQVLDLLVLCQDAKHAIEVKIRRSLRSESIALPQASEYLDRIGLSAGWPVATGTRRFGGISVQHPPTARTS